MNSSNRDSITIISESFDKTLFSWPKIWIEKKQE